MLCKGEELIYRASTCGRGYESWLYHTDHIDDATPMLKNGDITVHDIVKHYENHLSVIKIKEFVQSRPSIDPFDNTHKTVEKKLKHIGKINQNQLAMIICHLNW